MWWKFQEMQDRHDAGKLGEALVSQVPQPPVPVVSVARALEIEVTFDPVLEQPRTYSNPGGRQAAIEIPARFEEDVAKSRYLIALGIGHVLFGDAGVNCISESGPHQVFADAVLVPPRLLAEYGPPARWSQGSLATAFGTWAEVVRRQMERARTARL